METEPSALDALLAGRQAASTNALSLEEETLEVLVFQIENERYAFPGVNVREILSQVQIFFVPGCPPSVEGVINVRGDIESVINLGDLLGKRTSPWGPVATVLLGRAGRMQSGIRVDKVLDVLTLGKSTLQPPPATLPENLLPGVAGIFEYRNSPLALLNLEYIFEDHVQRLG